MSEKATANFLTTKHAFKLTTKQDARYVPVHKKKKNKTLQNRWRDTDPGYDNHISESFSPLVAIQNVPMQFVLVTLHRIVTIVRTSTTLRWPHSPLFKLKPFSLAPTQFSCDVIGGVSLFNNTNYVFEIISKNIKSVKE